MPEYPNLIQTSECSVETEERCETSEEVVKGKEAVVEGVSGVSIVVGEAEEIVAENLLPFPALRSG